MTKKNNSGKTAIILGGTAGIGRAIVDRLVSNGYIVGVIARDKDRLKILHQSNPEHIYCASADVADAKTLETQISILIKKIGTPHVWINSAMQTSFSYFADMEPEEFQRIVDVTLIGQVNGTRLALKHMKAGNVINISSGLSYRPVPMQSAYCAAKHALNGFTSVVRSEAMAQGLDDLHFSLIQLPAVNTPQFDWARNRMDKKPQPAPPIFQPEAVVDGVIKAIETNAREILVGRSVLQLIFGNFVLPDFLDKKLAEDAISSQKSDDNEPGDRPDNLFDPVAYDATARGRFSDRASDSVFIIDGDIARKIFFFGGFLLAFLLGLWIG